MFKHTINVLAKFKIPRIIEFVEQLPKTLSGKIRRVELRDNAAEKGAAVGQEYYYHDFPELSYKNLKN